MAANDKCAMTGCRRKNKEMLNMGQSNRGLGQINLVICARENHETELAAFYRRHILKREGNNGC